MSDRIRFIIIIFFENFCILIKSILEVFDAYIFSREYQMLGMPHTHNVFWFQYDDKIDD